VPADIAGLERRARRLLTLEVYDYYAGGAGRERTLRANVRAWLAHPMALAGVHALTGIAGVTGTHDSA
jgi:hypothetical protein